MDPKKWPEELSKLGIKYEPQAAAEWELVKPPEFDSKRINQNAIEVAVIDESGNPLPGITTYMTAPERPPSPGPTQPLGTDKPGKWQHMMGDSYIEKQNGGWGGGVHSFYVEGPAKSDLVTGLGKIVPEGRRRIDAELTAFEVSFRRTPKRPPKLRALKRPAKKQTAKRAAKKQASKRRPKR